MPFVDFNAAPTAISTVQPDFVIIGAGAAGIFLAIRLARTGRKVLLVESGHFKPDDERQALNAIEQSGKPQSNPIWNRKRVLGGTTTAWGGQSLPFSPIDFVRRDWVADSGWPFAFAELAEHYTVANAFMGIDGWNYDSDLFRRFGRTPPAFASDILRFHFSKWAPEPDFLKRRRRELSERVTVVHNAQLIAMAGDPNGSGRITHVTLANFLGGTQSVKVGTLILAAGGIETVRLLLLNDAQVPGGLGGRSGWLGRGFMDHPSICVGHIEPSEPRGFQRIFGTQYHQWRKYSLRMSAAESWQRSHRLLNVSATFSFTYDAEGDDPYQALKALARRLRPGTIAGVIRHLPHLAEGLFNLVVNGFVQKRGARVILSIMVEQEPTADSYLALGRGTDRFGLRQVRLHWNISEKTWQTTVQFARAIAVEFSRLQLGRVHLVDGLKPDNPNWMDLLSDVNHHMGGARMGDSSTDGVVDRNLQVWGVPNLYVASCAVFPTSSHSNPTLTLLALCSRLADYLLN